MFENRRKVCFKWNDESRIINKNALILIFQILALKAPIEIIPFLAVVYL